MALHLKHKAINNKKLNQNQKRSFSSKDKSKLVEEIRSGMFPIRQLSHQYQLSGSVLQRWNRWYFKTRVLKYVQPMAISISMTNQGNPGENAIAERINGTIKEEFNCRAFLTFEQAKATIAKAIQAYNHLRPHASCGYLTPAQAHQQEGPLRKRWRRPERKTPMNQTQLSEKANRILSL